MPGTKNDGGINLHILPNALTFKIKPRMKNYYNTNNLSGKSLKKANDKTETQMKIVLDFFKENSTMTLTVWELFKKLKAGKLVKRKTPIGSIRRAVTNLKTEGKLIKLSTTKIAADGLGSPEHPYRYYNAAVVAIASGFQHDLY